MKKIITTALFAFTAVLSYGQSTKEVTKPKQEVKAVQDTITHLNLTPTNLKQIYGIFGNTLKAIEESDIPSKKAKEIREQMQGLAQFLGTTQVKKEK